MTETRVDASANTRVDASADTRVTNSGAVLSDATLELLDASVGAGHRDGSSQVVYVLKASPMSLVSSTVEDKYFASTTFRTNSTDTPANTPMLGRLTPPNVRVTILKGNAIARASSSTRGTIKVQNPREKHFDRNGLLTDGRGRYDGLRKDYSWQGRQALMYIGPEDGTFATDFDAYFPCTIKDFDWSEDQLLLVPGPALVEADEMVQKNYYGQGYTVVIYGDDPTIGPVSGGSGGGAGTITSFDDLSGVPMPLAFGRLFGVPAQEISSINEIHQFHTGSEVSSGAKVQSLDAVYEDGLQFTLGADYSEDLGDGTFTLVSPTQEIITCDIHGAFAGPSDTYVDRPGAIVEAVLVDQMGLSPADIATETLALYDIAFNYECGYYFGDKHVSRNKFLEEMLAPLGFAYRSRNERLKIGYVKHPQEETATLSLAEKDIAKVSRKSTLRPVWRVRIGYAPVEKVIPVTSFAGAVDEDELARQSNKYRWVEAKDAGILETHKADDIEIETRFSSKADAQALADEVLRLYGQQRDILEVKLLHKHLRYDIGDIVQLQWPRYDMVDDGSLLQENGDKLLLEGTSGPYVGTGYVATGYVDSSGAAGTDEYLKEESADGTNFMCVGYVDNPASNDFTVTLWG